MPRTARDSFDEPDDHEDDAFDGAAGGSGLSDRDDPDPADQDDDDDVGDEPAETVPCPFCRKPVYEGADICPHCRNFIAAEDAPRRLPLWIWAGVILCLVAVLLWFL